MSTEQDQIDCGSKCEFAWLQQLSPGAPGPENVAQRWCSLDIGHSGPHHDGESGATVSTDLSDVWCGELHPNLGKSSCYLPKGHAAKEHMTIGGNRWLPKGQAMAQAEFPAGQQPFTLSYAIDDGGASLFLEHPELGVFTKHTMGSIAPADLKRLCEIELKRSAEFLRVNYKLNVVIRKRLPTDSKELLAELKRKSEEIAAEIAALEETS